MIRIEIGQETSDTRGASFSVTLTSTLARKHCKDTDTPCFGPLHQ